MARREKRRLMDAQRGKCRVRLGSHLEEWCALKDHLGFAQHAQVAKFLLDSYISTTIPGTCAPTAITLSVSLASLKRLAVLCHQHARDCPTPLTVLYAPQSGESLEKPVLRWGCKEHQFSWSARDYGEGNLMDAIKGLKIPESLSDNASKQEKNSRVETRQSKRKGEILSATMTCPQVACPELSSREDLSKSDQSINRCSQSIVEHQAKSPSEDRISQEQDKLQPLHSEAQDLLVSQVPKNNAESPSKRVPQDVCSNLVSDIPSDAEASMEICPVEESIVEEVIATHESSDDSEGEGTGSSPVDEEFLTEQSNDPHPNKAGDLQGGKKANRPKPDVDEELAQICKKRIRKATHPELLMCEYDDCGKIFSKRQYLNYHQKYQHMNQRTFRCSVTDCGKSFNFKKHLKEHEKRHSDRRDYICEFCARAFRSSSNLIIHRRIHTGEKPLQCEFCGFTCRQKASLNWHMKKHDAASFYQFPCDLCGQRFEKRENLAAHKNRKHPEYLEATVLLPAVEEDVSSGESPSLTDLASGAECPKAVDQMAPQDNIRETALHEYLDLTEGVLDSQSPTQAAANLPVVIVL